VAIVLSLPMSTFAQSPPPMTDTSRGLSIGYSDGRVTTGSGLLVKPIQGFEDE
jgi:hypothetical protein